MGLNMQPLPPGLSQAGFQMQCLLADMLLRSNCHLLKYLGFPIHHKATTSKPNGYTSYPNLIWSSELTSYFILRLQLIFFAAFPILQSGQAHCTWAFSNPRSAHHICKALILVHHSISLPLINSDNVGNIHVIVSRLTPNIPGRDVYPITQLLLSKTNPTLCD